MTPVKKHRSSFLGRDSNSSIGVRTALPVPRFSTSAELRARGQVSTAHALFRFNGVRLAAPG